MLAVAGAGPGNLKLSVGLSCGGRNPSAWLPWVCVSRRLESGAEPGLELPVFLYRMRMSLPWTFPSLGPQDDLAPETWLSLRSRGMATVGTVS